MMTYKHKIKRAAVALFLLFGISNISYATVYFYYDAENANVGDTLPYMQSSGPNFCQNECWGDGARGTIQTNGGAPQGDKYFVWETVSGQTNHGTDTADGATFPIAAQLGRTYYLAYFFRFDRINNNDIWHIGRSVQSADKGIEIRGTGIRWILSRGQWGNCDGSFTTAPVANAPSHYTIWMGNPTYHLNDPDGYFPNLAGYSCTVATPQLEYEKWYSAVMIVKIANDNTGSIATYLDGVKILEYNNITTAADASPTIDKIEMGGTMAQPAYDAPPHLRKFDAMILTDDWQDIVDGGYLLKRPNAPVLY